MSKFCVGFRAFKKNSIESCDEEMFVNLKGYSESPQCDRSEQPQRGKGRIEGAIVTGHARLYIGLSAFYISSEILYSKLKFNSK